MKQLMKAAIFFAGLLTANTGAIAQDAGCDRRCLGGMLDQYLAAVVAKDPTRAPLRIGFRQTQNAVLTPLGGGVWQSVTALGPMQRRYFDPVTGNAAYFGVIREGDQLSVASLRLRVENRKITEAEWHIGRRGDAGITGEPGKVLFDVDNLIKNPPANAIVPKGDRLSRAELEAIVNSYFDGIAAGSGDHVLAHGGCTRLENGLEVTGRPLPQGATDGFNGRSDCMSGYERLEVVLTAARRYPLIDEEAQVVLGSVVFIRTPGSQKRRNHFMEVFDIDHGKIRGVYAAMFYVDPNLAVPNWAPYEGNFPLVRNPETTR